MTEYQWFCASCGQWSPPDLPYCQWCAASRGAYDDLRKGPEPDIHIDIVCEEPVPSLAEIIAAHQAAIGALRGE